MKRFVIGDIHGAYKALTQVLDRSGFSLQKDLLICLGDVCDGWPETKECMDLLMLVENLIYIWGNHDEWCDAWMRTYYFNPDWWYQGGKETAKSFANISNDIQKMRPYREFFYKAQYWHHIDDEKSPDTVFVHGGFNWNYRIEDLSRDHYFTWDRDLFYYACSNGGDPVTKHNRVFIGHTAIEANKPLKFGDVWNMDTGAGWDGVLSIMNIDTEEYWTSDLVTKLYPDVERRR
jgi:serine/threonine protein phosphatase 1